MSELSEKRERIQRKTTNTQFFISRFLFNFNTGFFAVELQPVTTWLELNFGEVVKTDLSRYSQQHKLLSSFSLINVNLTHLCIVSCHEHNISNKYKTNPSYCNFCRLSSSRSSEREGKIGKFDHNGAVRRIVSVYNKCGIKSIFKLKIINCILFGFSLQGHKTRRAWMKWGSCGWGIREFFWNYHSDNFWDKSGYCHILWHSSIFLCIILIMLIFF